MAVGPVSSPAEIHCATVFALLDGQFSRLGGVPHPHTSSFVPTCSYTELLSNRRFICVDFFVCYCIVTIMASMVPPSVSRIETGSSIDETSCNMPHNLRNDSEKLRMTADLNKANDVAGGDKMGRKKLENDKELSSSRPLFSPRCVTYVRQIRSKSTIDGFAQYQKRRPRRVIAIETCV